MRLPPYGPDGAGPIRRALQRSPIRQVTRVWWRNRGITPTDVMVASYPRSGSLWLRHMLVELLTGEASVARAIEMTGYIGRQQHSPHFGEIGGRLIKTHEIYQRRYRRAIHLVRDPRDALVSYYSYTQIEGAMKVPPGVAEDEAFDRFVNAFIGGRLDAYGSWQQHVDSWTEAATSGHVELFLVRYEDLRADACAELRRLGQWLRVEWSEDDLARAIERSSLEHMEESADAFRAATGRKRPSPTPVINRGHVGGWRQRLTDEQARKFAAFAAGLRQLGYPAP